MQRVNYRLQICIKNLIKIQFNFDTIQFKISSRFNHLSLLLLSFYIDNCLQFNSKYDLIDVIEQIIDNRKVIEISLLWNLSWRIPSCRVKIIIYHWLMSHSAAQQKCFSTIPKRHFTIGKIILQSEINWNKKKFHIFLCQACHAVKQLSSYFSAFY